MGNLECQQSRIMLFPDLLPAQQRYKFRKAHLMARDLKIKYFTKYPATLCIETEEGIKQFRIPESAESFLAGLRQDMQKDN